MGRHSVADDDADPPVDAGSAVAVVEDPDAVVRGRHAVRPDPPRVPNAPGAPTTQPTTQPTTPAPIPPAGRITPPSRPPTGPPVEAARPVPPPAPRITQRQHTSDDLALLREHGDLRGWCAGAVLVPLLVYLIALAAVVGDITVRRFLIWLWIPFVVIGLSVGLILDLGHKRYPRRDTPG